MRSDGTTPQVWWTGQCNGNCNSTLKLEGHTDGPNMRGVREFQSTMTHGFDQHL
jgi:hypothetical protein